MWSGAELAFRGIGASLGLGHAPSSSPTTNAKHVGDESVSASDRFADASFDRSGADADASVVTKVSILEPEVDVSELAEALGVDEEEVSHDVSNTSVTSPTEPEAEGKPALKVVTKTPTADTSAADLSLSSPLSPTQVTSDAASIRTSSSAKAFKAISVTSAAWYNTKALRSEAAVTTSSPKLPSAASIFNTSYERAGTPEAFDTSLGNVSVQSEHHDFELDGWGHEKPQPFQSFQCFVGESDVPLSHDSLALLQEEPYRCEEYRVSFTTRRLLTLVLIEKVPTTSDASSVLGDAWQLLRRTQRVLNDYDRTSSTKKLDDNETKPAVRFLHLDGPTLTYQSSLEHSKTEEEVHVVAESHCTSAMELMRRHGVVETFNRSSNGKTWTASRLGKPAAAERGQGRRNQTYMVLAGKKISIVDCDTELRKLANEYPSFGI